MWSRFLPAGLVRDLAFGISASTSSTGPCTDNSV